MCDHIGKKPKTSSEPIPKLKLTYFPVTGRAEPTRLAFAIGRIDFEDERVPFPQFLERKASYPFGSVPVLEIDGGGVISQSDAILRYAGKLTGLYPSDPIAAIKVDEFCDGVEDLSSPLGATLTEKDQEKKLATRKDIVENTMPRYFSGLEKLVRGKFVSGEQVSIADLRWYAFACSIKAGFYDGVPTNLLEPYPKLSAVVDAVDAIPEVQAWNAAHA